MAQLELLGALERKDEQLTLTPLGRKMAAFPLEPRFAKVSRPHRPRSPFATLHAGPRTAEGSPRCPRLNPHTVLHV